MTYGNSEGRQSRGRHHNPNGAKLIYPSIVSGGAWSVGAFLTLQPSKYEPVQDEVTGEVRYVPVSYKIKRNGVHKKVMLRDGGFISVATFRMVTEQLKRHSTFHTTVADTVIDASRTTRGLDFDETESTFEIRLDIGFYTYNNEPRRAVVVMDNALIKEITRLIFKMNAELMNYDGYDPINSDGCPVNTYDDE